MARKLRTIAVLTENNAYGSIVQMVLAGNSAWRVRLFSTGQELESYARIVDIDVLVCDVDFGENNANFMLRLITRLRLTSGSVRRVIVTTRSLANWSYPQSIGAGVDEVLIKPMSPVYLSERVAAHVEIGTEKHDLRETIATTQNSINELTSDLPFVGKREPSTPASSNVVDFSAFLNRRNKPSDHADA